MVFLQQQLSSRKRPSSSFVPPFANPKIPKSSSSAADKDIKARKPPTGEGDKSMVVEKMVTILAEAGCTLINISGSPMLPSDPHKLRHRLERLFSSSSDDRGQCDSDVRADFVAGFCAYVQSHDNFHRVLTPTSQDGLVSPRNESLVRHLLLVPCIQSDIQSLLLEKLPEYFDLHSQHSATSSSLQDDVARLIINQFRWLDFIVDPDGFVDKLMQILSICPSHLKKEIIGSLPEIIGDRKHKTVVNSLEQILQEDSSSIVPVLDAFSNLNLDEELQEQVTTIALSCIRTIDADHMPYLLRFLLLSATSVNVRLIITHIREQLKFLGVSHARSSQNDKLKGKTRVDNTEVSVLDALKSNLRFKNILCQEILKELGHLEKPQDHKIIDIWLLMLIYMNGESMQKSVERIFKRKIMQDCIQGAMIDQCICGNKELIQDYLPSFLSLSEHLLACKEQKARDFGMHMYTCLFEELSDTYSRQEVLGALVTHVGSGVTFEVRSALDTMGLIASKHAQELVLLSSHISGILDYLEGFSVENLHKVYEIFSNLALSSRSIGDSFRSSIANELMMIIRKQVSHPDLRYKKMGLIGTLKMVSCLGDSQNVTQSIPSQGSNCKEALELLKASLNSCKQSPLALILFYDELATLLESKSFQPAIMEWIGKHVGEFENIFLSDLEGGNWPVEDSYCGLKGELWMNLDGDISPVCVNILPLVSSSLQSSCSLQVLPANFLLLSTIERLTNRGSLGGIDALLGCPLHLPSFEYLCGAAWKSLTGKQKHVVCLSLYYASNWIRELLNAFSTQVAEGFQFTSQCTEEDIISKLLKRLRNLIFLESLLNKVIESFPLSLPELHFQVEHDGTLFLNQQNLFGDLDKKIEHKKACDSTSPNSQRKRKRTAKESTTSNSDSNLRQLTMVDYLKRKGALTCQEGVNGNPSDLPSKEQASELADNGHAFDSKRQGVTEVSAVHKALELQRFKFRGLMVQCYYIVTIPENLNSCCPDPEAKLPLYLYLLRDLHCKLDYLFPMGKLFVVKSPNFLGGVTKMAADEFLNRIRPLFPSLRRHFNSAVRILKEGDETCQDHWKAHSVSSGNQEMCDLMFSKSLVSTSLCKEVLHFFSQLLNLPDIQKEKMILLDLLQAFKPMEMNGSVLSGMEPSPSPGSIEYLYLGAYSFVEDVLEIACSFSSMLAFECLLALESIVTSIEKQLESVEGDRTAFYSGINPDIVPALCGRLGNSAEKLLRQSWVDLNLDDGWKSKAERIQKILRIYVEKGYSSSEILVDLACSALPQVSFSKTTAEDENHGFPTLCSSTFTIWCRVLHEVNLAILMKLVKEAVILGKRKAGVQVESVQTLLMELQQCVNVVVSLVNLCKTHEKVTLHAMAVKYGGKFVTIFLKVFDFLQIHFQAHGELIIQLVKELQKATRTIQTLCSEAKGLKQLNITGKIPATKKSMERFLFHVKALLHATSSGNIFWIGNLKHKNLMGQVVSSQAYVDENNDNADEVPKEAAEEEQPVNVASGEEEETEL